MTKKTELERVIYRSYPNIGGLAVMREYELLYETYFKNYNNSSRFHVFSVTKSIISMLIGIAIDKGYIQSVEQKILEFFPTYHVNQRDMLIENVTIKDMITMNVPYKFKTEPYKEYFESEDWVKYSLGFIGGRGKIGEFRYMPLIGPDILSGILVAATGESVLEFARKYLFEPLDILVDDNIIFKTEKEQMDWYKEKNPSGWVSDSKGNNTAGWGLALTAVDMVKLGALYSNKGIWKGQRIISSQWVEESTMEHNRSKELRKGYGYLWWIIDEKEGSYAAIGDGGNIIYINEMKQMVISIAAIFQTKQKDIIPLIKEYIEPFFENM